MNVTSWIPVIVEVTKFTLEQLGKWVDLAQTQERVSSPDVSQVNITLDELSEDNQSQLVNKIRQDLTPEKLRSIKSKYDRAKNFQRQIEFRENALARIFDSNSNQAMQLQFEISRLQEDELFPLVNELNQDLSEIYMNSNK